MNTSDKIMALRDHVMSSPTVDDDYACNALEYICDILSDLEARTEPNRPAGDAPGLDINALAKEWAARMISEKNMHTGKPSLQMAPEGTVTYSWLGQPPQTGGKAVYALESATNLRSVCAEWLAAFAEAVLERGVSDEGRPIYDERSDHKDARIRELVEAAERNDEVRRLDVAVFNQQTKKIKELEAEYARLAAEAGELETELDDLRLLARVLLSGKATATTVCNAIFRLDDTGVPTVTPELRAELKRVVGEKA